MAQTTKICKFYWQSTHPSQLVQSYYASSKWFSGTLPQWMSERSGFDHGNNFPRLSQRRDCLNSRYPRILSVLDQWLNSDYFDLSLGSELQGFLMQDVRADRGFQNSPQVQSMLGRLEQLLSSLGDLTMSMVRGFVPLWNSIFVIFT
jgi:hypothetical protein